MAGMKGGTELDRDQALALARRSMEQEVDALQALRQGLDERFYRAAVTIASCPGMVWTAGVGTSAAVAERFAHILNCCGRRSMFLHPSDSMHGHAGVMAEGDLLVAMSRGGESAEVNALVAIARRLGVSSIAMVHRTESTLAQACDLVLPVPSKQEYELQGVIATTSTVAYCAMCDALAAVAWEITGYTLEKFGRTHPGGAVGKLFTTSEKGGQQ
jgi:arabinose-5-phosphate isomerase